MAHGRQQDFCKKAKQRFPDYFKNVSVLDIGSLDINGNNHYLFEQYSYTGLDLASGRNVSYIGMAHLFHSIQQFDLIVSTECFEHDQYWQLSLKNICDNLLKQGGFFLMTCATTGRPEHGTRRTTVSDSPFTTTIDGWGDYYQNLTEADFRSVIDFNAVFDFYGFSTDEESHDLYFWGIKK